MLVLLIALAIVMILRIQEIKHVDEGVRNMAPHLLENGVEASVMSHREARETIEELETMCRMPSLISEQVPRLREVAAKAASWAAGAPTPSPELTAAVALRKAALTLRDYALHPSEGTISRARRQLQEARVALEGGRPVGSSTDALRDRLQNLEQAHREHLQELEEAY